MRTRALLVALLAPALCVWAAAADPAGPAAPPAPAESADASLVRNPSFEERSGPRKPYPEEPWGYGLLDTVARSPWAHWGYSGFFAGDYDVKLAPGRTGPTAPGVRLRFRGFFKGVGAKGPCYVNAEGDPGENWARINLPDKADYDWTEVCGEFTVKPPAKGREAGNDGKLRIHLFIYTEAYGELWVDDVSLTPVAGDRLSEPRP
jgi:hypothetical protein